MKTLIALISMFLVACSTQASPKDENQPNTLVFGVVPQQSPSKLARNWLPLLSFVSEQSGYKLKFATAPDIPTFEKRLARGDYDVAYMNPYHYVALSKDEGFNALAYEQGKKIQGIIVANKTSSIEKIEDLSSQSIAFPAPAAFAATLIPQASLLKKNIQIDSHYVNSHDAVYRNIATGRFVAGGGIIRTFNALPAQTRQQLKIIWVSGEYTPHAIATHPRIGHHIRLQILKGLLQVNASERRVELLNPLRMKGFAQANDQDWNDVRELGIHLILGQK